MDCMLNCGTNKRVVSPDKSDRAQLNSQSNISFLIYETFPILPWSTDLLTFNFINYLGTGRGNSANNLLALAEASAKENNAAGGREDKDQGMLSTLTMGMLG